MHDLMNDLATFVAGDFFSRLDIGMKKEYRKGSLEKYRHISYVCEEYMVYEKLKKFEEAKTLRTFLTVSVGVIESWRSFYLSNKVLANLLQELPKLRVLSLSNLSISEIPASIGSMKHLRYLNLSRTKITHLSENVCNLYRLQTLILFGCASLTILPNSFLKFRNLRHLDIRDTPYLEKMPLGIGELKSLRILSKIIIGGESGFAITQLKNLQNLHGKISIMGLGNVQNAMEAREANLSQKRLSELELDWGYKLNDCRTETHDKEILNELKPHSDSLEKLKLVSYRGIEFPNWVGDPSFLGLTHISIYGCDECTSLPRLGQLPSLKELSISNMSKVKVVGLELLGTGHAFPSLKILHFGHMTGWEVWSTNNGGVVGSLFPNLQELCIEQCPNLVTVSLEAPHSLRVLKLKRCGHVVLTSVTHVASSVTKLKILDISGLTDELWRGVINNLGKVKEVTIERCNGIRYLWESESKASKVLVNLKKLKVQFCENLVSLGEKEEDNCGNNLTSLRSLKIHSCRSTEHCNCPDNIESLDIYNCDSLTFVSFQTGGGHKLKSFRISDCKKLLKDELGVGGENTRVLINNKSTQMMESIYISDWQNLKSISELSCFIHLTNLIIRECPSIKSFPDHELPNLTSLTSLIITNCPGIASLPSGLWPPKLRTLEIGGLKKPISKWGPQNFPPSVVHLRLWGGSSEDVTNFSRLSHLFPSSLTSLGIREFEKLESLSVGLHHLTSLQYLYISMCPKTRDLPETLMPSLLHLTILECPKLKEWSSRRGSYWPVLSLIPRFEVDGTLQS